MPPPQCKRGWCEYGGIAGSNRHVGPQPGERPYSEPDIHHGTVGAMRARHARLDLARTHYEARTDRRPIP